MMNNYKTTEEMVEVFRTVTEDMCKTFKCKNHDYGNSFFESLDSKGIVAAIVRMGDKMNRLDTLCTSEGKVKDESQRDTLLDLANYAIMTVMWLDGDDKVDKTTMNAREQKVLDYCNKTIDNLTDEAEMGGETIDTQAVVNGMKQIVELLKGNG